MFGYHDNDRCMFDLWSPVDENRQCDMSDPFHCATENRAFSPYAKHTQEIEDAINTILTQFRAGNYSFTMNFDDDISDSDVEYIQAEVERRL